MKRYLILITGALSALGSYAQDIFNTAAILLPQSPATSYVVSSGQTVRISSNTSVTLLPGTELQSGSNVSVFIGNSPSFPAPSSSAAADLSKNWIQSKTYDEDGNLVAEAKSFFDNAGQGTQTQVKNLSTGHVIASEILYDALGRPAATTLPAPTNNAAFAYKSNFVSTSSGAAYGYANFDEAKTLSPDAVGNSSAGTLGWYYSANNSLDAHVGATSYPYMRTDFFHDGTGAPKRSASAGDPLRMGAGHEPQATSSPVLNELDFYKQVRDKFFPPSIAGEGYLFLQKAMLNASVDENGKALMQITDLSGNTLVSALPESGGWQTVSNSTTINNVANQYTFNVSSSLMDNGQFEGSVFFSITSPHTVTVYRYGTQIYQGDGSSYQHTPSGSGGSYDIVSDYPFYISSSEYDMAAAKVAEPNKSSIHYFHLFSPSAVTVTGGTYELYEMSGETKLTSFSSGNTLSAGYYKLMALNGDVTVSYSNVFSDISYNFYNQLGQLLATVAPEGVKQLLTNGLSSYATLNDVPFVATNEYDLYGRVIATTQTDAGRTEFVYRKDGSIRFSQNEVQRGTGDFSYTNYDLWGRAIESGEYTPGDVDFTTAKTTEAIQESIAADGGLSGGNKHQNVKVHYDDPDNSHGVSGYTQDAANLKGAVSWTENYMGKTWYNYDSEGRVAWIVKQIDGWSTKTVDYSYGAKGNVTKVDFQKDNSGERFTHDYVYDEDGRFKVVYTSTATSGQQEQARYYYYLHGPLKRVELAGNLQGMDYVYTPQGFLKAINHPNSSADPGQDGSLNSFAPDAFSMTLEYFDGDYTRSGSGIASLSTGSSQTSYSGSIMAQSWKSLKPQSIVSTYGSGVNNPAMFTYEYDSRYRFNNNKYGAPNFGSNAFTEAVNVNREHNATYDSNGNILSLNRTDALGGVKDSFTGTNYHYTSGTNKLSSVDNYATYTYDGSGRMSGEAKTSGQGYYPVYTATGKVLAVYSDAAKTTLRVAFGYDEQDNMVKKADYVNNITTYYVYDANANVVAVYDNNGSAMLQKEVPIYSNDRIGIYKRQANAYLYELSDQQGNVRVVINGVKTSTGQPDVVSYSDYYPFGSPMTFQGSSGYRYDYQGQYSEKDPETSWSRFALRMYDAAVGRWLAADPINQYWSPYSGMGNDPLQNVDPNGGETKDWYLPIGSKKASDAKWFEGSGPVVGYEWKGGEDYIFQQAALATVTILAKALNKDFNRIFVPTNAWRTQLPDLLACYRTCVTILQSQGIKNPGPKNLATYMVREKGRTLVALPDNEKGIALLNQYMQEEKPMIVGVDRKFGGKHNEGTTDHFVIIVGWGKVNNEVFYYFFDPGTARKNMGTSSTNRFYINRDGVLQGVSAYNKKTYTVSQVRRYGR